MEPQKGRNNIRLGIIEYDHYTMAGQTDIRLSADDAVIIKDENENNKLKISLHCGELIFQYPACEGWSSEQYKLTSKYFQETSIINMAGNHCLNFDCDGILRGLQKMFETGPYVQDQCNDVIRLKKGLYRFMMHGEAKFEGCGESTLSVYPGIKRGCNYAEPIEVFQMHFRKDYSHADQYVHSSATFYMNFDDCTQDIRFYGEGATDAQIRYMSISIEYCGQQHQDTVNTNEID